MLLKDPTFMEKYNALPFLEKKILQILSIAYAKLTQTQLLACFVALNIKTEDGKRFDSGTKSAMLKLLRNALDALLGGDLLNGKSRSVLVVNRGYIEVLTRHLVAEKKFIAMADTLQKTLNLTEEGFAQEPSLSMDQLMAGMRILFYQEKVAQTVELYENFIKRVAERETLPAVWEQICCYPFDPDWFRLLPPDIHTSFLEGPFLQDMACWRKNDSHADYLEALVMEGSEKCESDLEAAVLEKWMLTGQQDRLDNWRQGNRITPAIQEASSYLSSALTWDLLVIGSIELIIPSHSLVLGSGSPNKRGFGIRWFHSPRLPSLRPSSTSCLTSRTSRRNGSSGFLTSWPRLKPRRDLAHY